MQKKKIINFRPLFYSFLSYGFAIVFASKIFFGNFLYLAMFLTLILIGFLLAFYKKAFLEFSLCAIFIVFGVGSFLFSLNSFTNAKTYDNYVVLSGTVSSIKQSTGGQQVVLKNIAIYQEKQTFSVSIYNNSSDFSVGDSIQFYTQLDKVSLFSLGKFSSYYYNNKIFYTASYDNQNLITHTKTNLPFKESIKQNILNSFLSAMPENVAHIAYGAMFGDASGISSDIYASFRDSGIIHILSVSGMHMVIVVALVDFLLRRLKLNKHVKFSLFVSSLLFYAFLCSFNVTVVRSAIMSMVLIFGTTYGKRYDMLNAIGLSGLLILIFKPLMIFDIGFQLSFLSVFMIAAFAKPISNFLKTKKLGSKLSTTLGVSIAVQAGILPLTLQHFGQFPLIGTIGNLIAVPIFELGFVLAFVMGIVLLFLPFLTFLLVPISFLYSLTIQISNFLASIDFLMLKGYLPSAVITLFFLLATFILSQFVMLRKNIKKPIILILAVCCFVFSLIDLQPKKYDSLTIFQASYTNSNSTIFVTENENVLVSDLKNLNYLNQYLHKAKITKLNVLILSDGYNENNVHTFTNDFQANLIIHPSQTFQSKTFSISYLNLLSGKQLPIINVYGYSNLILPSILTEAEKNNLSLIGLSVKYNLITDLNNLNNITNMSDYIISKNSLSGPNLAYKELNNWYFRLKNGKIDFVRSLN